MQDAVEVVDSTSHQAAGINSSTSITVVTRTMNVHCLSSILSSLLLLPVTTAAIRTTGGRFAINGGG
jgi:hypothetical protein